MDRAPTSPYIAFRNVTVRFSDLVVALRNVSLEIGQGEFVFFCGPTGAGKSTLLKLLTRDVHETEGKTLLNGRDLTQVSDRDVPALRRAMGIIPQDFALLPRKKVWENIAYAMRAAGATRKQARNRAPDILEMVGMGHRIDAYPHELSGGEQQRVAIGRALINNPQLLVADEPTGNLDPDRSFEIMDLLAHLNRQGATVLVASHDMLAIERTRARIVRLDHGQIAEDKPPLPEPEVDSQMALPLQHDLAESVAPEEPLSEELETEEAPYA
jgi:cell division transport system ATP-binding protein